MKYANTLDFTSHYVAVTAPEKAAPAHPYGLIPALRALFRPRCDPARMGLSERRAAGVCDHAVARYLAAHGPLIKHPV